MRPQRHSRPSRIALVSLFVVGVIAGLVGAAGVAGAVDSPATLAGLGAAGIDQNFDTLTATGTTSTVLPSGLRLSENGTSASNDGAYRISDGTANNGDTYSFGPASNTDRAFGSIQSSTLAPVSFGYAMRNDTGSTITALTIAYTGEFWRFGATGRTDTLDASYTIGDKTLGSAGWTDVNALDFVTPSTAGSVGARDGSLAANRVRLCTTLTGISVPANGVFILRWADANANGADDGLAVDNLAVRIASVSCPADTGTGGGNPGGGGGIVKIHDIQGSGAASPMQGQTVTIEGVVTGIDDEIGASFGNNNTINTFPEDSGIYVQEETADADSDPNTSEGIFVGYVRNRGLYPPGTKVQLNGTVVEKFGQTMIDETINEEPQNLGPATIPSPVVIDLATANGQDPSSKPYYESLEGMLVSLPVGVANSGGTNKFGELFLVPGTSSFTLQRTDPAQPGLIGTIDDAGSGDPDNPYRPTQANTVVVNADKGDTVHDVTGPLNFSFSNYKIAVQDAQFYGTATIDHTGVSYPYNRLAPAARGQIRIASFNVENYFPVGGALDGGIVSQAEFDAKTARLTDAIGTQLHAPDVVAVQEVYDLATLQVLAASLQSHGFGTYTAYLQEGNDNRGIDVGFLAKSTVTVNSVTQYGLTAPGSCSDVSGRLFDRPPLALEFTAPAPVGTVILFSNHFASKSAPDSCREAQATFVRDQVSTLEAQGKKVIVAGDLNAFEDEGALSILGGPVTTLTNQWNTTPAEERYSFNFQGLLQTLDHVLVNDAVDPLVVGFQYAHLDNDYYERGDSAAKVSDHDPPVLTLGVAAPDPVVAETPWVALFSLSAVALVAGALIVVRRRSTSAPVG
jgi:predicted extracellular nuclease